MERYLCIIRRPAPLDPPSTDSERAAALDALDRGGQLLAAFAPDRDESGVVVRVRAGQVSVAVAAPESAPVDAVFVLQARDLNEAIHLAARDPGARHGLVEVRLLGKLGPSWRFSLARESLLPTRES